MNMELEKPLDIKDIAQSHNVADLLPDEYLDSLGIEVVRGYVEDLGSRTQWEQRNADSFKLALQIREEKTYPWVGASNVKFPLITVASMQFHARAYPATVPSTGLVKAAVYGPDFDGENTKRSDRIGSHMTWQLMEESPEWEVNHDKGLLTLSIVGDIFKKTYFDSVVGRNIHELVMAKDLVVNYWSKTLEDAPRFTHVIPMSPNKIRENVVRGVYKDIGGVEESQRSVSQGSMELEATKDDSQGMQKPIDGTSTPINCLEQHCWLDLDKDGYAEPYIVTVREIDSKVYRIVARFIDQDDVIRVNDNRVDALKRELRQEQDEQEKAKIRKEVLKLKNDKKNEVVRIVPTQYFTHYQFIPSPDGGFYGIGLGSLLGPINESIDSAINQLIDAGTSNNLGGGFLGAGVSFKSGVTERDPGSWIPLNGRGDDVHKSMLPFPQIPQNPILLQLLQLLIQYGERVAGTTDIMVGVSPGQNTPAETSRNTVEQGMKVFTAIYKRIWRSMKQEFKLIYQLNRIYLDKEQHYMELATGKNALIKQDDYLHELVNVVPAADPNITSESEKVRMASELMNFAKSTPGVNVYEAGRRYLHALKIPGIDVIYPDPKGKNAIKPQTPLPIQIEQIKAQNKQEESQAKLKGIQIKLMSDAQLNEAKIQNLQAQAVKALADANGVGTGHAIMMIEMELAAAKHHKDSIMEMIKMLHEDSKQQQQGGSENGNRGDGVSTMAEQPDNSGSVQ